MKQRLGKATLIGIVGLLIMSGYVFYQTRMAPKKPPIIERNVESSSARGISPVPEFLTGHAEELKLTDAQKTAIDAIATEYRAQLAPLKQPLEDASAKLAQKVTPDKNSERTDINKLQAENGEYQRLSAQVSNLRHEYWQQASAILTPAQQPLLKELLKKVTAKDLQ